MCFVLQYNAIIFLLCNNPLVISNLVRGIKSTPLIDRPREKLIRYGPEKLSAEELLAIVLGAGGLGRGVMEISKDIIKTFDTEILDVQIADLVNIKGIGPAKACEVVACFELGKRFLENKQTRLLLTPKDIWNELKDVRESKKEHFVIFFLDAKNQEIKREIISIGTLTESLVHPREVFEPAIKVSAAQIVLAHNHPSGELFPSTADIDVTDKLCSVGEILDIEIIDHVIVGREGWCSMKEKGMI